MAEGGKGGADPTRVASPRDQTERELAGMHARVSRLEQQAGGGAGGAVDDEATSALASAFQRIAADLPRWAPLVTPLLVLFFGFLLKDSAEQALQLQKLELETRRVEISSVSEMRTLIAALYDPDSTKEELLSASLAIAAYGGFAAAPLLQTLDVGDEVRLPAAETGLKAAALLDPERVCSALGHVLDGRGGLYSWQTHKRVIRLMGGLACVDSRVSLEEFRTLLGKGMEEYVPTVRADLLIDAVEFKRLQDGVTIAISRIDRAIEQAKARERP